MGMAICKFIKQRCLGPNDSIIVLPVVVCLLMLLSFSSPSHAKGKKGGVGSSHILSTSLMLLASSTQQGGSGPEGSSILSQTEYMYVWNSWVGTGLFYQVDKQGSTQTDNTAGPKLEFYMGRFFIELGYALLAQRSFTDRTIAEQTGSGSLIGFGFRFRLSRSWIFQAAYKYRTITIEKQDGAKIDEAIVQTDGYPLFGIGMAF